MTTTPHPKQPWPDHAIARLIELFNDGLSDRKIARAMGRTAWGIATKRRELNLFRHSQWTADEKRDLNRLFNQGYDDAEIAWRIGKTPSAVEAQRIRMRLLRAVFHREAALQRTAEDKKQFMRRVLDRCENINRKRGQIA